VADISDRVLDAQENNTDMANFLEFTDIPDSRHDEDSLAGWLYHSGELSAIPKYLRTELVLQAAAYWDVEALTVIDPSDSENYYYLIDLALSNRASRIGFVDNKHFSEELIVKVCSNHPRSIEHINWDSGINKFLTKKSISQIASSSILGIHYLIMVDVVGLSEIADEDIKSAIVKSPDDFNKLEELNKLHLLSELLSEGFWPEFRLMTTSHFSSFGIDIHIPPASIKDSLEYLSASTDYHARLLCLAVVRNFPIESIIPAALDTPGGVKKLFDIYSEDELKPYIKQYRPLRGMMLEQSLGL
jgi:hypothetical protein